MLPRLWPLAFVLGCADPAEPPAHPDIHAPAAVAPIPLVTDACDDPTYPGMAMKSVSSPHFTINYLPGTAAEADRIKIDLRLEDAYSDIRSKLGVTAEPAITVNLSPSRAAATAHGYGFGVGWPGSDQYDAIYTGVADSFEVLRYGQLTSMLLNYYVDSASRTRVAFLTTGVGEYLDQWQRDRHDAYALQLIAGVENRVHIADFETRDVTGKNAGRAGSFVQFLVERYGMDTFADIYRASAVAWNGSCWASANYGCVSTPAQLTAMMDGILTATVGEGWSTVQPLWQAEVEAALARAPHGMDPATTGEIENLVATMDEAVASQDAPLYRTTLEGFYCDYGGESLRQTISARAVSAFSPTTSKVLAIYDTGIKNFHTAQAFVQRTDAAGVSVFQTLYVEHLPAGWRVTWGPDWF